MQPYQYLPLRRISGSIRLLRLLPSEVDKAEIRAELLEYNLANTRHIRHSYEALSYVWGGLDTTRSIFIGDEELAITPNLHAALLRLRDDTFPRVLWVDAVCINQSDISEKESQIQSMAKIYGYARCTIVWLGEEADMSDTALESIRIAGHSPMPTVSDRMRSEGVAHEDDERIEKAVTSLLQREWFLRIWVLQEMAASRHVIIVCGPTEIDGHAFCLGFEKMRSASHNTESFARVSPVVTLIKEAIFRPKLLSDTSGRAVLDMCPLGDLINMYSAHIATRHHDRIHALLGMTTDDFSETGISPNYTITWQELWRRLAACFFGEQISSRIDENDEDLEITGRGCIIGNVVTACRDNDGTQLLLVDCNKNMSYCKWDVDLSCSTLQYTPWQLRAIADDIWEGDIIYLLDGAARPLIMRPAGLFFHLIAISVASPVSTEGAIFGCCLSILWNWTKQKGISAPQRWFPYHLHESKSYWTNALIMQNTNHDTAGDFVMNLARLHAMPPSERARSLASSGGLPSVITEPTESELTEIIRCFGGSIVMPFFREMVDSIRITEKILVALVQYHSGKVVSNVLEEIRQKTTVTPMLLEAAAKNIKFTRQGLPVSNDVLEVLLDRSENHRDLITEAVLIAFVGNPVAVTSHMLDRLLHLSHKYPRDLVTEAVLTAAARNSTAITSASLKALMDHSNDHSAVMTTLLTSVDSPHAAEQLMRLLWDPQYGISASNTTLVAVLDQLARFDPDTQFILEHDDPQRIEAFLVTKFSGSWRCVGVLMESFLFVQYQGRIPLSLWVAAVTNDCDSEEFLYLLLSSELHWREECHLAEDILVAAANCSYTAIRFFLENQKTIRFPDGVATPHALRAVVGNNQYGPDMMKAIARYEGRERVEKFFEEAAATEFANDPQNQIKRFSIFQAVLERDRERSRERARIRERNRLS